jgi:hypothetical protein
VHLVTFLSPSQARAVRRRSAEPPSAAPAYGRAPERAKRVCVEAIRIR